MRIFFVMALLIPLLAPASLLATAQIGEVIMIDGQRRELIATPLEGHLGKHGLRPNDRPGSTACWRGYVGVWRIAEGELRLRLRIMPAGSPVVAQATSEQLPDSVKQCIARYAREWEFPASTHGARVHVAEELTFAPAE